MVCLARPWLVLPVVAVSILDACHSHGTVAQAPRAIVSESRPPDIVEDEARRADDVRGTTRDLECYLLTARDPSDLVDGPLVALQLDDGAMTTLCGEPAAELVHTMAAVYRAASREALKCLVDRGSTHTVCIQHLVESPEIGIMMELAYAGRWRFVSIAHGHVRSSTVRQLRQLRAAQATATCAR